jgi:hypothetical protein
MPGLRWHAQPVGYSLEHLQSGYAVAAAHDCADLALREATGDPYAGLARAGVLAKKVEDSAHVS